VYRTTGLGRVATQRIALRSGITPGGVAEFTRPLERSMHRDLVGSFVRAFEMQPEQAAPVPIPEVTCAHEQRLDVALGLGRQGLRERRASARHVVGTGVSQIPGDGSQRFAFGQRRHPQMHTRVHVLAVTRLAIQRASALRVGGRALAMLEHQPPIPTGRTFPSLARRRVAPMGPHELAGFVVPRRRLCARGPQRQRTRMVGLCQRPHRGQLLLLCEGHRALFLQALGRLVERDLHRSNRRLQVSHVGPRRLGIGFGGVGLCPRIFEQPRPLGLLLPTTFLDDHVRVGVGNRRELPRLTVLALSLQASTARAGHRSTHGHSVPVLSLHPRGAKRLHTLSKNQRGLGCALPIDPDHAAIATRWRDGPATAVPDQHTHHPCHSINQSNHGGSIGSDGDRAKPRCDTRRHVVARWIRNEARATQADSAAPLGHDPYVVPTPTTSTVADSGLHSTDDEPTLLTPKPKRRGQSFGRYVVLHELGSGGMGVVYAAYDPELDRRVALKVLGAAASEETGRARLLREAQTMARISHPNVITVHDVGEVDDRLFIAMELVDGVDLKRWLADGDHAWPEVLDVLLQAGRGLAAAHDQGLIHRDFKPANVLVGQDGLVRVLDFGLARRFGSPNDDVAVSDTGDADISSSHNSHTEQLTRTGAVAGTPAYMSPEQHARAELDGKSDQFSFCITAFEALFGERPFEGSGRMALMLATTQGNRRPVPKSTAVPRRVVDAVLRGLEPKADDRWPDMRALLEQLEYKPASRRALALGAVAITVVGGIAAASVGAQDSPCAGLDDLTAQALAPSRPQVEAAFGQSTAPYAQETLDHALGGLEAYAQRWTEARLEVCKATHVRRDRSEPVHDLAVACLDRHRRDFEATVDVLAEADADTVEQASALVDSLPALEACEDVESLLSAYPAPTKEQRPSVQAAEAVLARGRALLNARRDADALPVVREAMKAAEATAHPPTIANAAFELAIALNYNSERDEAERSFHRAAQLASRIGNDALLAEAWVETGRHLVQASSRHDEAFRWFEYAAAVIERVPNRVPLEADLRHARASALSELGKLDEALAELDALDVLRGDAGVPDYDEEILRGNIYTWKADFEAAKAAFVRAGARLRDTVGDTHPSFAAVHNGLGVVAFSTGDLATAEDSFRKSYETLAAALPDDNQEMLFSLGNMAEIQRMRGNYDQAYASMMKVEALVERAFPAVHREVGTTNHNIASILRESGKLEQSLPRFDVALEVRRAVHGERHLYVANTLTGKGLALLDLGRAHAALPLLEEAFGIRGETDSPPRKRARTAFGLARALVETGGDPERARTLARDARHRLATEQVDATVEDRLNVIDAWLQQHGGAEDDAPTPPSPP